MGGGARVPDHELLVVGDGAEEGLVEQVPRHVLHHRRVASEDRLGVDHLKRNRIRKELVTILRGNKLPLTYIDMGS